MYVNSWHTVAEVEIQTTTSPNLYAHQFPPLTCPSILANLQARYAHVPRSNLGWGSCSSPNQPYRLLHAPTFSFHHQNTGASLQPCQLKQNVQNAGWGSRQGTRASRELGTAPQSCCAGVYNTLPRLSPHFDCCSVRQFPISSSGHLPRYMGWLPSWRRFELIENNKSSSTVMFYS